MRATRAVLVAALIATNASAAEAPTIHRHNVCDRTADGWCRAGSTPAGFSAEFPAAANDSTLSKRRLAGGELAHLHVVGVLVEGRTEWSTTCVEYLEGEPDAAAIIAGMRQQAESSHSREHQGVSGYFVRMKRGPATQYAAVYVGRRFSCVQLVEVRTGGHPTEAERERYFQSFRLPGEF